MSTTTRTRRPALVAFAAASAAAAATIAFAVAAPADGAVRNALNERQGQVLIGPDDDNVDNPGIQPAGVERNQSLRNSDYLVGSNKNDVIIGRTGPDVLIGEKGNDILIGGTERGSDVEAFPNSDTAAGNEGNDTFIWAPGDGNDQFLGGEPRPYTYTTRYRWVTRDGERVKIKRRVRVKSRPDMDILVLGTLELGEDNSTPALFDTPRGPLPRVNVSGEGLPATQGNPEIPTTKGFCEIVKAPEGFGPTHLVRFFIEANGQQAVTIRATGVERVFCRTRGEDAITVTNLDTPDGEPRVISEDWSPAAGGKWDGYLE